MTKRPQEPIQATLPDAWNGPRIIVRPFFESEAPALWQAIDRARAHLGEWLPWVSFYQSEDDARAFIRHAAARRHSREDFNLGIIHRASGEVLGGTGFHIRNWSVGAFEIGYWIRPESQGQGYVSEAVQLLSTFLFDAWDANRVMIRCDSRNERSANVARRLGFVYEGTFRHDILDTHGQPRDTMVFALIRDDYVQVRPGW